MREHPFSSSSLLARLPSVRGKMTACAPLAQASWFRVGGPAEVLFQPEDAQDVAFFLRQRPKDVPVTILGVASNTLIRDGGVPGVVIKLGPRFASLTREGDVLLAGAAALDLNVARAAQKEGLAGLEFLSGIPGTIGGALRMNAGAHGREMKDVVLEAEGVDDEGNARRLSVQDLGFSYRRSCAPKGFLFLKARLSGLKDAPEAIAARMKAFAALREESQPVRARTGGSTFANPPGGKAWELIDKAGCRALRVGGAHVSEKHCNFILNDDGASAADIESLGEEVRKRVFETSGVDLRWEIERIGIVASEEKGTTS